MDISTLLKTAGIPDLPFHSGTTRNVVLNFLEDGAEEIISQGEKTSELIKSGDFYFYVGPGFRGAFMGLLVNLTNHPASFGGIKEALPDNATFSREENWLKYVFETQYSLFLLPRDWNAKDLEVSWLVIAASGFAELFLKSYAESST